MLVFLLSSCCPQQKQELERERVWEKGVWESVCVLTLSRNSEETRLIGSVAFLLFSRVVTAVAALGYYVSRAPMAENTPFPSPAAPPDTWLWEKSRRVLRVLWPAKCWPAWKAQCPWGSLISLFPFSQWLCLYPSTAAQLTTERKRQRETQRERGWGRGEAWGKLHPCHWKRKHLGGRKLDVFWLWCVSYLWWWWWCERGSGVLEHERNH